MAKTVIKTELEEINNDLNRKFTSYEKLIAGINYEKYEEVGEDYYQLGKYASGDFYTQALRVAIKNYNVFNAILNSGPTDIFDDDFKVLFSDLIESYRIKENNSNTPLHIHGDFKKWQYLSCFYDDIETIDAIRQHTLNKIAFKQGIATSAVLKSEILFLLTRRYHFTYFASDYIAKKILHIRIDNEESYEDIMKHIKYSLQLSDKTTVDKKLLKHVLYRVKHYYREDILKTFDNKFSAQIIADGSAAVCILEELNKYVAEQNNQPIIDNQEMSSAILANVLNRRDIVTK